jgi:hypothetical protein
MRAAAAVGMVLLAIYADSSAALPTGKRYMVLMRSDESEVCV